MISKKYTLVSLLFETTTDYQKNLDTLISLIKEAPKNSLIVAPEVCLTGYDYDNFDKVVEFASFAIKEIKKISQDKIIILTIIEKKDSKIYNFAKIFYNGAVVFERSKAKLFRFGDEHKYLLEGDDNNFEIVEVDGIKISVFICFELRFKEFWQKSEGSDVIAIPAWWGAIRSENFKALTRAIAIINQCYVVASDSKNDECTKMSGIITPQGEVRRNENISCLIQDYDKKEISLMRRYMDVGIG